MPAVSAPAKVLVTGASGFIGIHVVKALVDRGYFVRGTVRTDKKGKFIQNLFGADKFEWVIVEDMEVPNAYDEAVKGMDAVEHTASVTNVLPGDPDRTTQPAIKGTTGVLESIKKFAPTVKRVVITSSIAAIGGVNEQSWNEAALNALARDGANAPSRVKYGASKTLAERAAWEFVKKNKAAINFDVTTLCPVWVWGPMLHEGTGPESVSGSLNVMLQHVDVKNPLVGDALITQGAMNASVVDVRDVDAAHADVLGVPGTGGEHFIVAADGWSTQDIYDALNEEPKFDGVPVGQPGASKHDQYTVPSADKVAKLLGKPKAEVFRPLKETIRDTFASVQERHWVPNGLHAFN